MKDRDIKAELGNFNVKRYYWRKNPNKFKEFGVSRTPTIIGREFFECGGVKKQDLIRWLRKQQ